MDPNDQIEPDCRQNEAAPAFLTARGEMAALMRAFDWSDTPLGPVRNWPQSLRTAVDIILSSRYAMFVWWGGTLTNLYNDAYRPFLGKKHPEALGLSASDVWAEIWDQIGPRTVAVLERGESTFDEALLLPMDRHGYLEETYFTFSYSPIRDDAGGIGGIFCAVTEETARVIGERRLKVLRDVGAMITETHAPDEVCAAAIACISSDDRDLPFVLIYLADDDGRTARLVARAGAGLDPEVAAPSIDMTASDAVWPLAQARTANAPVLAEDLRARFARLPTGGWDRPPTDAVVVQLAEQGQGRPAGFLVAGLNPFRRFDEDYRGFIGLLAGQIAAGIANARAHETERKRAEALAEIDRAKTAFFSNVSHEFRTPLTLMLGPLEDALTDSAHAMAPSQRARLELAQRNALRLQRLVDALLDFSRVEAGRVQAVYRQTDLAAFTADIASGFRSACEKAGLSLTIRASPLSGPVFVDREMWEKIVLNLVSNAFKFTLEGGIDISLANEDAHAVLRVSDTGVGIPEAELPRLFERFHRVEGTRGRTHEGTGIGLALVRELVNLHKGAIEVDSRLGQGTTFSVRLALGTGHLPRDRIEAEGGEASTAIRADAFVAEALRWLPDGFEPLGITPGGITPAGISPAGISPAGISPGGITPGGITPGGMPNRGT